MKGFDKLIRKLTLALILFMAALFMFASCTCKADEDDDDANDDTNDDTDDDNTDDDDDDDAQGWYIYTIDPSGGDTSIAVDLNDKVHISYGFDALKYATNQSGSWQLSQINDDGFLYPSIAVDSNGYVHISYLGADTAIWYATNKTGSWQTCIVADVSPDAVMEGGHQSLALDSTGKIHIAYHYCGEFESSGCQANDLKYVTNSSKSGSWQVFTIDDLCIYPSISIDQSGKVHIAYYGDPYLKYATNQSGVWQKLGIEESITPYGIGTSIALDSNGKVHISYQTSKHLNHATNASGTWQIFTIDASSEDTGRYNSIAVDSNDYAHISYCDWKNKDLKYATNKTGEWQTFTLDSEGRAGYHTSIAIDSDNYIHVSYGSSAGLKYATNRPPDLK